MNPQRAQVLVDKIKNLQVLAAQAENARAAEQQVQRQNFHQWAADQDKVFDSAFPRMLPGVDFAKVKAQAMQTLRDVGIDDATARRLYNGSDVFRSSAAQVLMAKAAAWDAYQKDKVAANHALRNQRDNPVPNVIKPGVANHFAERFEEATRMPKEFASPKEAAEWLTSARRGGRR
jgi:hypothetical protein